MNFYVGNSIDKINYGVDDQAVFDVDFSDYLYKNRNKFDINMDVIFSIDPYADELIDNEDVSQIIAICEYILANSLAKECATYIEDKDEENYIIEDTKKAILICTRALEQGKGLVSIGD